MKLAVTISIEEVHLPYTKRSAIAVRIAIASFINVELVWSSTIIVSLLGVPAAELICWSIVGVGG